MRISYLTVPLIFCCGLIMFFHSSGWTNDAAEVAGEDAFQNEGPIEYRFFKDSEDGQLAFFRMDPKAVRMEITYANPPKTVAEFAEATQAILTINAAYWDTKYNPVDLLVVKGKAIKNAELKKNGHYGLLYIQNGLAALRDIRQRPLRKNERFDFALKSGPSAVRGGQPYLISGSTSDFPRNVIGVDKKGRIFFLMTVNGASTYNEFANRLVQDPINAAYAFHLDGGGSVSFLLKREEKKALHLRAKKISSVIQVFKK